MIRKHFLHLTLLLLLLLAARVRPQEEEEDDDGGGDEDEGEESAAGDGGGFDGFDNGFFSPSSSNFDELPGGVFDSDSDPIDYLDSSKHQSVSPRFSLPSLLRMRHSLSYPFPGDKAFQQTPVYAHAPNLLHGQDHEDTYDPERRRRYTGYDEEHEDSPATQPESGDVREDLEVFPRGSFLPLHRLPGAGMPMLLQSRGRKLPCDQGCDE